MGTEKEKSGKAAWEKTKKAEKPKKRGKLCL